MKRSVWVGKWVEVQHRNEIRTGQVMATLGDQALVCVRLGTRWGDLSDEYEEFVTIWREHDEYTRLDYYSNPNYLDNPIHLLPDKWQLALKMHAERWRASEAGNQDVVEAVDVALERLAAGDIKGAMLKFELAGIEVTDI